MSHDLVSEITLGDLIRKPGWIRMSIHPTTTSKEIELVCNSIISLGQNHKNWSLDYNYDSKTNEFINKNSTNSEKELIDKWFLV